MTSTVDRPFVDDTGTAGAGEPVEDLPGERLDAGDAPVGRAAGAARAFPNFRNRNPRMVLLAEITALLRAVHEGRGPDAH